MESTSVDPSDPLDAAAARPIRVMYRKELAPGQDEAALVAAWRKCAGAICGKAKGALGGELFRTAADRRRFVAVMRWESLADWRAFWGDGPPDPEGDPGRNEILIEVAATIACGARPLESERAHEPGPASEPTRRPARRRRR
jgi:heme-degrading monooxygenase HmoA